MTTYACGPCVTQWKACARRDQPTHYPTTFLLLYKRFTQTDPQNTPGGCGGCVLWVGLWVDLFVSAHLPSAGLSPCQDRYRSVVLFFCEL